MMRFVQFFFMLTWLVASTNGAYQRVCYLIGYNSNRNLDLIGPGEMQWNLCTHVIFAFTNVQNATVQANATFLTYMQQMHQPNRTEALRLMFSVGGPDFSFVKSDAAITRFIDSVIAFLKKYDLDGIDIDWEFPYETNDKKSFTKLLQMTRARLEAEGKKSGKVYLLSVALTPIMYIADKSYQVEAISKYAHFVNLMTYDFHTPGTFPYTDHNAPLYSNTLDIIYFKYFNVFFSVHYMHSRGLRKEQIMVGIPFYGYLYYLANPRFHDIYSLCNGTQVTIGYNQVCSEAASPLSTRVFDRVSKVPYLYNGNQWITYDDRESVLIKSQWIVDNGFGGSMTFALNYDDFRAKCHAQPFPLQSAIYDILG